MLGMVPGHDEFGGAMAEADGGDRALCSKSSATDWCPPIPLLTKRLACGRLANGIRSPQSSRRVGDLLDSPVIMADKMDRELRKKEELKFYIPNIGRMSCI